MKPNKWPVTACLLLLMAGHSLPITAENKDDYVKALGNEAKATSTEKDAGAKAGSNTDAEPSSTPGKDTDSEQLTAKVIGVLEKTLMGAAPQGVSEDVLKAAANQESQALRQGLQSVVSDALDDGTNIDDIRQAVETALQGFQEKQPEVKTEKLQSINEMMRSILTEGSDLAEGNPKDAYIALLQGELDDTTVTTEKKEEKKEEKSAAKPAEAAKAEDKKAEDTKAEKKTELAKVDDAKADADKTAQADKAKDEAKDKAEDQSKAKSTSEKETETAAKSTEQSKEEITKAVAKSPASDGKQGDKYVAKLKDEAKMTFVTIQEGDTLSKIAIRVYGTNKRYWDLFRANQDILGDNPDLLLPGQVLKVPK